MEMPWVLFLTDNNPFVNVLLVRSWNGFNSKLESSSTVYVSFGPVVTPFGLLTLIKAEMFLWAF